MAENLTGPAGVAPSGNGPGPGIGAGGFVPPDEAEIRALIVEALAEVRAIPVAALEQEIAAAGGDVAMDSKEAEVVIAILERSGARDHAEGEARRCRDRALQTVAGLPIAPERRAELASLIETSIAV